MPLDQQTREAFNALMAEAGRVPAPQTERESPMPVYINSDTGGFVEMPVSTPAEARVTTPVKPRVATDPSIPVEQDWFDSDVRSPPDTLAQGVLMLLCAASIAMIVGALIAGVRTFG